MLISRNWVTPLAAGAFLISAVTGVLIFFHLDTGLNKVAHEWLSWILLAAVVLHGVVNLGGFKRHFSSRTGLALMGVCALVLVLSFVVPVAKREPPFMASVRAVSEAPLTTVSLVAHRTPDDLRERLVAAGYDPVSMDATLGELVGPDMGKRMRLLEKLLAP